MHGRMTNNVPHRGLPRRTQRFLSRLLALLALMLATPDAAQFVEEVVSLTVGAAGHDCCDDGCDDGDAQGCEGTYGHCVCCAHPNLLPMSSYVTPEVHAPTELTLVGRDEQPYASGYSATPFRPPTA